MDNLIIIYISLTDIKLYNNNVIGMVQACQTQSEWKLYVDCINIFIYVISY